MNMTKKNVNKSNNNRQFNHNINQRNKFVKNERLVAECKEMCPNDEFNLRVNNNLVNPLEKRIIKYSFYLNFKMLISKSTNLLFIAQKLSII
jgi:hypothetical protein